MNVSTACCELVSLPVLKRNALLLQAPGKILFLREAFSPQNFHGQTADTSSRPRAASWPHTAKEFVSCSVKTEVYSSAQSHACGEGNQGILLGLLADN